MNTKLASVADDYISRCKWLRFQALVPQADPADPLYHKKFGKFDSRK